MEDKQSSYKFAAKNPHACVWNESRFSLTCQTHRTGI